jgi:hypothetical protein
MALRLIVDSLPCAFAPAGNDSLFVMPAIVAAIPVFSPAQDGDGRGKPGHDAACLYPSPLRGRVASGASRERCGACPDGPSPDLPAGRPLPLNGRGSAVFVPSLFLTILLT